MSINRNTKVFPKAEILVDTTSDFFLVVRDKVVVKGVALEMGDYVVIASFSREQVEFFTYLLSKDLDKENWRGKLVDDESSEIDMGPSFICLSGAEMLEQKVKKYYQELQAFSLKAFFGDPGSDIYGPERKVQGNMVCYSSGHCIELVNKRNQAMDSDWYDGDEDTLSIFTNMLIATEQENGTVLYEIVVSVDCSSDVYTTVEVTEEFLSKWYPEDDIPAKIKQGLSNQAHLFTN